MRSRILFVMTLIACVGSLAFAAAGDRPIMSKAGEIANPPSRTHGTLGGLTVTLTDEGGLQGTVDVGATTAGGSGFTALEGILLYGQMYDTPWVGTCSGTDVPGVDCNLFITGDTTILNGVTGGPYSDSWTFTVPTEDVYQAWGLVMAGWSPYPPFGTYSSSFWWSQRTYGSGNTALVQQATPTFNPDAGGLPVPTMGVVGIVSMVLLLGGVAILLITRRS